MLELLAYLRASGFTTFIVSGGGVEFMRPWSEPFYGVPPQQVVGSSIKTRYEMRDETFECWTCTPNSSDPNFVSAPICFARN